MKLRHVFLVCLINCFLASVILSQDFRRWDPVNGVPVRQGLHAQWSMWDDKSLSYQTEGEFAGEVAVVWSDARNGDQGIYLQVILPEGEFKFEAGGIMISDQPGPEGSPQVLASNDGSWIVTWQYAPREHGQSLFRDNQPNYESIYCMKVNSDGERLWEGEEYGVRVCDIEDNWIEGVKMFTDDASGCYITWVGKYSSATYVVRVNSQGEIPDPWEVNGVQIGYFQWTANYTFPDGDGGLLYIYGARGLRLTRIMADGSYPWGEAGIQIAEEYDYPIIRLCRDDGDGYFLAMRDRSNTIVIHRISQDGEFQWENPGELTPGERVNRAFRDIVSSDAGSAIIVCEDHLPDNEPENFVRAVKVSGDEEMILNWEPESGMITSRDSFGTIRTSSDGAGGIFSIFVRDDGDDRQDLNCYAQKIDSDGETPWGEDGMLIIDHEFNSFWGFNVVQSDNDAVVFWENTPLDHNGIFAQKVDESGELVYPEEGMPIISGISGSAKTPILLSNGNYEFALVWNDERKTFKTPCIQFCSDNDDAVDMELVLNGLPLFEAGYDQAARRTIDAIMNCNGSVTILFAIENYEFDNDILYAQKVDRDGQKQWGEIGVRLSDEDAYLYWAGGIAICPGNDGETFVAWMDRGEGGPDKIEMQKLNSRGESMWEENTQIAVNQHSHFISEMLPDGMDGAAILWVDNSADHIKLTRVGTEGELLWGENRERVLFEGLNGGPENVSMIRVEDGYVAMLHNEGRVLAQIVNDDGTFRWRENGAQVGNTRAMFDKPSITLDNDGNIWTAWYDGSLKAQKIEPRESQEEYVPFLFNVPVVIPLPRENESVTSIEIAYDGNDGIYTLWEARHLDDNFNWCGPRTEIYAYHMSADGIGFQPYQTGFKVAESFNLIENLQLSLIDRWGESGVVFAYLDHRPGIYGYESNFSDLYIQRLDDDLVSTPELVTPPPSEFQLYKPFPNPFNSTTTIEYALPIASDITLNLFGLSGRRGETLVSGRMQAGVHRTMLDAGDMASGLYFLKLEGVGQSFTQKIMLVK
jgi:hypothetical protein